MDTGSSDHPSIDHVRDVLGRHRDRLLALAGVVGTGVGAGHGGPVIHVYTGGPVDGIPAAIEDVPVEVIETGEIEAL